MSLFQLGSALRVNKSTGEALNSPWQSLSSATAVFRKPQLVLIASAPGGGKSALALNLAIKSGASCIYFSADSGPRTQLVRSMAITTGRETSEIEAALERGYTFDSELRELTRIWWEFDAGPDLDTIEESVLAHGYLGAYPDMCVIDNLMNVDNGDTESEFKSLENILLFGLELSRSKNMCVIVLHHLTGEYEDGRTPPPLSALRGKVGKVPEMVLTLWRASDELDEALGQERMGVAIVKNRDGIADPSAMYHSVELEMNFARMNITDSGLLAA